MTEEQTQPNKENRHKPPIPHMGRARHPITNLTAKQEAFAQGVARGLTLADAYRQAYDAINMKPGQVYTEASHLVKEPKINHRVAELAESYSRITQHDPKSLKRVALETILAVASDPRAKHSDRLKAAELLGKVHTVQLFTDNQLKTGDGMSEEQVKSRLELVLTRLQATERIEKIS